MAEARGRKFTEEDISLVMAAIKAKANMEVQKHCETSVLVL